MTSTVGLGGGAGTNVSLIGSPVGARVLPHDHEAEVSVLGALMLDPNAVAMVRDRLVPEDFYSERHGHIYRASLTLADQGQPIDPLMLRHQLERGGALAQAGGVEYIAELSASVFTAASLKHYADIVYERALKRRLIVAGGELASLGFDESLAASEALDRAEQRVYGLADQRRVNEATHVAPVLKDTWTQLETLLGKRQFVTGVPTNFSELDQVTQGLQPSELIILAARPSVGKTAFALNVARNAAVLAHEPVCIFSLEMSKESLVQRLLCSEAHVDSFLLKTGQADAAVFSRIAQAMDRLTQADLYIDDTPALSIHALRSRARRMKAQYGIKLIVVDYLQLMRGGRQEFARAGGVGHLLGAEVDRQGAADPGARPLPALPRSPSAVPIASPSSATSATPAPSSRTPTSCSSCIARACTIRRWTAP